MRRILSTPGRPCDLTGVRALVTPAKMVGRAITVRTTSPDSALVHAATAMLEQGDTVLGDDNGVLIPPTEIAHRAAEETRPREAREPALREHLRGGGSLAEWSGADRMIAQRHR